MKNLILLLIVANAAFFIGRYSKAIEPKEVQYKAIEPTIIYIERYNDMGPVEENLIIYTWDRFNRKAVKYNYSPYDQELTQLPMDYK